MENDTSELDELQADYKKAVESWIAAIRKEEALASVHHSSADLDAWEEAGFEEHKARHEVIYRKKLYEDGLREDLFGF